MAAHITANQLYCPAKTHMHRHNSDKHKNIPIYVVMVGHISDMADIYLTWQTYVVYVRYMSNQIRIFMQNDNLYIGMVGHITF